MFCTVGILVAYLYNFSICITHFEMEEQKY